MVQKKELLIKNILQNDSISFEYYKIEKILFELVFLFSVTTTQSKHCESLTSSEKVIHLLLYIHHIGTPRLQRICIGMLKYTLPSLNPHLFDTWNLLNEFGIKDNIIQTESCGIIPYFFELIGKNLCIETIKDRSLKENYISGQV